MLFDKVSRDAENVPEIIAALGSGDIERYFVRNGNRVGDHMGVAIAIDAIAGRLPHDAGGSLRGEPYAAWIDRLSEARAAYTGPMSSAVSSAFSRLRHRNPSAKRHLFTHWHVETSFSIH